MIELLSSHVGNGKICFKRNYETLLLQFLQYPRMLANWQHFGLRLTSYGLEPPLNCSPKAQKKLAAQLADRQPAHHHNFLISLPPCFALGDYISSSRGRAAWY